MASLKEAQADKAVEKENPFKPSKGPSPNHPRPRLGKTHKDRSNSAKAKNQQNKDSRAMWQHDSKRTAENFPYASCNGKRNHYQKTGPDGQTVFLKDSKRK